MHYQQRSAPPPGGEPDEFVMSDGSIDRMGDVIDPGGWQLDRIKSDPPVLFNHDRDQIVGRWTEIRVKDGKLIGKIVWVKSDKWPMAQYIRDLVNEGILRTVSVGFQPIESEPLEKSAPHKGKRFKKSILLECSLVSVPANPNALAVAKDLPRELIAEIFRKPATEDLIRSPADHGKPAAKHLEQKSSIMSITITQKITAAQETLNVLRDSLQELAGKQDLDADEVKRYDELPKQIEAAKGELAKHKRVERSLVEDGNDPPARTGEVLDPPAKADPPANLNDVRRIYATPKKKTEPGDYYFRALSAWTKSQANHDADLGKTLREMYGSDELTGIVLRAAVNPAATTVATWAAELVHTDTSGFLDRLMLDSIYLPLANMGVRYTFGTANKIAVPVRTTTSTLAGAWVGEGAAKPVKKASFTTINLVPNKLAVISTFTEEMATYSPYAIEQIIRQAMSDDTSIALDSYLIDNVAASATRPAGLLNGITPITASVLTPSVNAMIADLKALVAAIVNAGGGRSVAIIINPAQAMALGFAQTTTGDFMFDDRAQAATKFGVRFIVSATCPAGRVIAVDAADFATANGDTPKFAVSTDATLHEEDTNPLALGTGTQGSGVLAVPMRSLFQTDAVAVRMSLYVGWIMRRTGMVQTIASVSW